MGDLSRLPGAKILGQPQGIEVKSIRLTPALFIEVVDSAGTIALGQSCLQVVDPLAGECIVTPLTLPGAINLVSRLTAYIEANTTQGSSDGDAAVHE